jgi:hypothetical protein
MGPRTPVTGHILRKTFRITLSEPSCEHVDGQRGTPL